MAIAFGLGLLWMTMTGIQTKLLVKTRSEILLMMWAFITSLIWGFLVRAVTIDQSVIIPYAVGTAMGVLLARKIGARLEK